MIAMSSITLSRPKRLSRGSGFTIVELLIVLVVIAILAAISIVVYHGIQKRAQTAQYVAAADMLEKQVRMGIAAGQLDSIAIDATFCIGAPANFPTVVGEFSASECVAYAQSGSDPVRADAAIAAQLHAAGIATPPNLPTVRQGEGIDRQYSRGFFIAKLSNSSYLLAWYPPDTSTCGRAVDRAQAAINELRETYDEEVIIATFGENWEDIIRAVHGGGPPMCYLAIRQ